MKKLTNKQYVSLWNHRKNDLFLVAFIVIVITGLAYFSLSASLPPLGQLLKNNSVVSIASAESAQSVPLGPEKAWEAGAGLFQLLIFVSVIITLILQLIVALIFAFAKKITKKILLVPVISSLVCVPLMWIIVNKVQWTFYPTEILLIFLEAWLLKIFSKKQLNWKWSLIISLVMNFVSFLFGAHFTA